jgi:hypothetical protein
VRIGIDARKLHDFGIGTYIRNLLHELAKIDRNTEYVLLTRPQDTAVAASLGENFRAVADRSDTTRSASRSRFHWRRGASGSTCSMHRTTCCLLLRRRALS